MKNAVNFAIYGCGMIANVHIKALLEIENACVKGVADINGQAAQEFAEKYSVLKYDDLDAILNDKDVDAVCICTPNSTHAALAIKALKNKKHVVLEKPMAISTLQCDSIIEETEKSGCLLTVISQLRVSNDIIRAKEIIDSGVLGKPVLCDLYMKYYRDKAYYAGNWKGTKQFDGGGALMNQGIHGVDILQYLAGNIKNVKSFNKTLVHDIEVEDTSVSVVEFESGALGVIEATTSVYPGFSRKIQLHFTNGSILIKENKIEKLIIKGRESEINAVASHGTQADPTSVNIENHKKQLNNFVNAVIGTETLIMGSTEGKKAVEIIERIYKE
ncbi:MAG: Gfo/Idh/MocA family oxidoreductase [Clostridia bacterium]|nr:Gfo/Idh/MocA family oxidoreductase [Clostridia bacterium]